ncbi:MULTISPECIES: PPOX class F420-dependent oxidoreductase [Mycolicibacterium]|jgi:PPOX class probable F420-dependent enzyme|uniref:Pyridoxamine 5'-phosphate oxidase-related, FMN-binding protein n=2 Tax=Mycolicibacterium TaxID=1866885 RepID=A1TAL9_MYCVP|nr:MULTISPECIES: PPOX class F420-dependent oxidoreductase [Mycolicibacterium]ABM14219.1 pyridoxamine 5'-phosphate oxidase-related, FMN-binding protein [Mycolicibacterium vanbaalenii PYR-1]MCV7129278.1 PPOX class F420-dependent oxidoreductase [Mycolicibacterium vanbaalenii PYR-1]MDN4520224.1 PPOX class F420-dependent oxidoreductase [Mycolicibacterium austroafricanum]MDW5614688.1 PPOX class F420-dependent oxidoreductase [Mycolicibacterium sp. D5.8-2]PQP42162.1 PPOX class F420-dependent oxidoredu
MTASFADVAESEYILLTTFTKDGRPKPTAIWAVPSGEGLVAITQEGSWKVKRIRNTPRVTIAKCDRRGNPKGEPVEATARILDKSANATTYDALGRRYGLLGKTFNFFSKLRGGMEKNVSIELRPVN